MSPQQTSVAGVLVDRAGVVQRSELEDIAPGRALDDARPVEHAALLALAEARSTRSPSQFVARDPARGAVLVVTASPPDPRSGASTVLVGDLTPLASASVTGLFQQLAHELRNVSFALSSVLDVAEASSGADPVPPQLLREPVARLTRLAGYVARSATAQPLAPFERVTVAEVVERALARVAAALAPTRVTVVEPTAGVLGDPAALAEGLASLVESGGAAARAELVVGPWGAPPRVARFFVERRLVGSDARAGMRLWDPGGGRALEPSLRLALLRSVVVQHAGEVFLEPSADGRCRIGFHLPLAGPSVTG